MQTATQQAERPKTQREQIIARNNELQKARALSAPRFYVQFTSDHYRVDTDAVPGRTFRRGQVTPLTDYPVAKYLREIPAGALIPGSEHNDREGKTVYGRILQHAGPDAERLEEIEAAGEHGLFPLASLLNRWDLYEQTDFDALLYPGGLDALPETHEETLAYLRTRRAELQKEGVSPEILQVVDGVIKACEYAMRCQERQVEETHRRMKLPPGDENFKARYDRRDEEALLRTGKARFDSSTDATAKALTKLADDRQVIVQMPQNDAVAELVKAMQAQTAVLQQQLAEQSAVIAKLVAERQDAPKPQNQNQPPRKG